MRRHGINVPFVLVALSLATRMPAPASGRARRRPDWLGAGLCALGLAGPSLALVRQPALGWDAPLVAGSIAGGVAIFALFLVWERRGASDPMPPLGLFGRGNLR